ncbi:hypothetical protein BpHYR1_052053 [Brachionus plicatilis]|uniref:Uncharacterized protein n=1 Tax=Brachionus plicatilis TaxID=10195 RepID=A0A3M7RHU6_BRAPC|nr:hypothetical protein BpHYR1_052053 [Brachionus plicatilis]
MNILISEKIPRSTIMCIFLSKFDGKEEILKLSLVLLKKKHLCRSVYSIFRLNIKEREDNYNQNSPFSFIKKR